MVRLLELLVVGELVELPLPSAGSLVSKVHDVGRPVVEAIKDVGGIDDGSAAVVSLFLQPAEKVLANANVQASRDLVEEENFEGPDQAEKELDPVKGGGDGMV